MSGFQGNGRAHAAALVFWRDWASLFFHALCDQAAAATAASLLVGRRLKIALIFQPPAPDNCRRRHIDNISNSSIERENGMGAGINPDYSTTEEYVLWCKYEDVAMHFNDLIMRLRTQALGGLTGVVAISGFAMNFTSKPSSATEWTILFGTFLFFTVAWLALWVLDLGYYNRLLAGAVAAIIAHEERTPNLAAGGGTRINLSTIIRNHSSYYKFAVVAFYILVFLSLAGASGYAGVKAFNPPKASSGNLEYKLERTATDKLQLTVEPTSTPPTPAGTPAAAGPPAGAPSKPPGGSSGAAGTSKP